MAERPSPNEGIPARADGCGAAPVSESPGAPMWWKVTAGLIVAAIVIATAWIVEERSKPPPPSNPIGEFP